MDALKITFVNGEQVQFPFSKDSTLAVDTPAGVNGAQRGVWGEVAHVEYVTETERIARAQTVLDARQTVTDAFTPAGEGSAYPEPVKPVAEPVAEPAPVEDAPAA